MGEEEGTPHLRKTPPASKQPHSLTTEDEGPPAVLRDAAGRTRAPARGHTEAWGHGGDSIFGRRVKAVPVGILCPNPTASLTWLRRGAEEG